MFREGFKRNVDGYQFSRPRFLFHHLRTSPSRSFVQCFIDREGSIKSTRFLFTSSVALLRCCPILFFLSLSIIIFFSFFFFFSSPSKEISSATWQRTTSVVHTTLSSMILWFFRGRLRPALCGNKQMPWERIPLVQVWVEVLPSWRILPFPGSRPILL